MIERERKDKNDISGYDEFALITDTAADLGLPESAVLPLRRVDVELTPDQSVSAIEWGGVARPDLVLLHGAGQNAHTFDSVLVLLSRPALSIDLPGHGHSDWREDRDYSPRTNAAAVAEVIEARATTPVVVVGMSLGGLTAIALAATRPELVRAMLVIDSSPAAPSRSAATPVEDRGALGLMAGPSTFDSFDDIADAAVAAVPNRPAADVRRGVRHNSHQLADGRWAWRYDRVDAPVDPSRSVDYTLGWQDLADSIAPTGLVIGQQSNLVTDDDVAQMRLNKPGLLVQVIPDAGHSVQSDQPVALAGVIAAFVDGLDNVSPAETA